jgi:hypothetical protein
MAKRKGQDNTMAKRKRTRQHNGQKKKDTSPNDDLQRTTKKTKD